MLVLRKRLRIQRALEDGEHVIPCGWIDNAGDRKTGVLLERLHCLLCGGVIGAGAGENGQREEELFPDRLKQSLNQIDTGISVAQRVGENTVGKDGEGCGGMRFTSSIT